MFRLSRALSGRIGYSSQLSNLIIWLIIVNALVIGLETSTTLSNTFGHWFDAINQFVLFAFIIEATLKLYGVVPRIDRYFRDPWNDFDFIIILLSFIPATGSFATVARLARLLRVMRLATKLKGLKVIISTLLRSIPGIANVLLLLSIIFYIYGVMGFHLFHETIPHYWGTLGTSLLTLFRLATLDGWSDVMYLALDVNQFAWIFFISFVLIGALVIMNLFIGVVLLNIGEAQQETSDEQRKPITREEILNELREIKNKLEMLEEKHTRQ